LNTAYMADQISLFGIVVGIALLLSGIGFGILAIGGALRNPDTAVRSLRRHAQQDGLSATPTA
jgi:F0F1-type ATP synthase membrane subunit c/vacuolar-type H+-ATPase subunit K